MTLTTLEYKALNSYKKQPIDMNQIKEEDLNKHISKYIRDIFYSDFPYDEDYGPKDWFTSIILDSNLYKKYPNYDDILDIYFEHAGANSYYRPYYVIESMIENMTNPEKIPEIYQNLKTHIENNKINLLELETQIEIEALGYIMENLGE